MVDANGAFNELMKAGPITSWPALENRFEAAIHVGPAALAAYAEACRHARFAPPQDPHWVESWCAAGDLDPVTAILSDDGTAVMALALQIELIGPFRVGRFIGGTHANGNFPALSGHAAPDTGALRRMLADIRRARPDIDMLALERQMPKLEDAANPFLQLAHRPSPNIALATDLTGGFEAVLERVNGKRKRKKYRSQLRKFESVGGFRRFRATDPAEVDMLLGAFFEMKRQRFAAQGIADVFAGKDVQDAFHRLYIGALGTAPQSFFLEALEVGGKIRAVTGSSLSGRRIVCDFCAFADDELTVASPGDFLFFESIREACEQGYAIYDFSVGEERYKRAWCDIETEQFDVLLPLSPKGRLLAAGQAALARTKRAIKQNETLWRLAKRARQARAAPRLKERTERMQP